MNKRIAALLTIIISVGVVLGVVFIVNELRKSLTPPDVSVSDTPNKLSLSVTDNGGKTKFSAGDIFKVGVKAEITSGSISVAELVLTFDKSVLKANSITEASGLLSLNKTTNNSTGQITLDVAKTGTTNFANGEQLAQIEFQVLKVIAPTTIVSVERGSTLGVPNTLGTSGFGTLAAQLNFVAASSSSSATSKGGLSSSSSSSGVTKSVPSTSSSSSLSSSRTSSSSSSVAVTTSSSSSASSSSSSSVTSSSISSSSSQSSSVASSQSSNSSASSSSVSSSSSSAISSGTSLSSTSETTSSVDSSTSSIDTSSSSTTSEPVTSSTASSTSTDASSSSTVSIPPAYTGGSGDQLIPGVDSKVIVFALFGLSGASGVGATYLYFRKEPDDVS